MTHVNPDVAASFGCLTSQEYQTSLYEEKIRLQVYLEHFVRKDGREMLMMIVGNSLAPPENNGPYVQGTFPNVEEELHRRVEELLVEGNDEDVGRVLFNGYLVSAIVEFEPFSTYFRNLS